MDLRVLGVLALDEGRIDLAPRDRLVLSALVARIGASVSVESLATALWGENPPVSWPKVIPGCIMRLRRSIAPALIETSPVGYRLVADSVDLDASAFERFVARGSELLALGEPDRAAHALTEALALWRGQPFADLPDWEPAQIESSRLEEIRLAAEESLLEARLQAGDLLEVVAQARVRVTEAPMRERRWVILALAQYRQGRQADALATVRRGRDLLASELGLDPCAELAALERAILRQDPQLDSGVTFRVPSAECPYFGLPPAGLDDAERFFGREEERDRGLRELDRHGVLLVSGSSGVGKSSFVRACIGAHFAARGRRVIVITPGERPVNTLAEVAHDAESLLIVDQCEQAFANEDPDETGRFFDELGRMVFRGAVVMTIRADRLGELAGHVGFAGLIQSHLLMLGPMSVAGLRAIIDKPARNAGLILEPGLVEILIRDADGRNLPLLSHALHQVWQRREGRVLSVDGYRDSGEIAGAVAQTAEQVFAELAADDRRRAREILLRLVEPSQGGGVICQRVDRASVATGVAHTRVADRLVDARLVTSDEESFQLAHEAVAREWPRLREWLAEDAEGQRIRRHVSAASNAWDAMGRPASELYRGARLSATVQWRAAAAPVLSPVEDEFLAASIDQEAADVDATRRQLEREQRSVRRLRWLVGATASLAALALAASAVAAMQVGEANRLAVIDDARRVSALASAEPVYERALLLAVEAIGLWDAPATRAALLEVMGGSPRIVSVTRTADVGVQQMSLGAGSSLAVLVDNAEAARVIDIDRGMQLREVIGEGTVLDAVEAPDGKITLSMLKACESSCENFRLGTLDLAAADLDDVTLTGFEAEVIDIAYSPDQSHVAMIAPLPWVEEGGNVAIGRADAPDDLMVLDLPDVGSNPGAGNAANAFGRVVFSPDGALVYASGFGPTAIFDTRTGALVRSLSGEGILAVSPDGRSLIVREGRTAVRVLAADGSTAKADLVLEMPDVVADAAFSPDGDRIVTIGGDHIWMWSTTGTHLENLEGHVDAVTGLAFRSDGRLVTVGDDGALITWAMDDWSAAFRDSKREGSESLIREDERALVYSLADGSFVGISADPGVWRARACAVAGRSLTEQEWGEAFGDRAYDPACADGSAARQ